MFTLFIVITIFFLIKLGVDYVQLKTGVVLVSAVKGFVLGFEYYQQIIDYEDKEQDIVIDVQQTTIEICLGFISIVFSWQEDIETGDEFDLT